MTIPKIWLQKISKASNASNSISYTWFLRARNRNTIASDASPISPGGVRLGSCAMTTRMVDEEGFKKIGAFLIRARDIAKGIQKRQRQTVCCWCLCWFCMVLNGFAWFCGFRKTANSGNLRDSVIVGVHRCPMSMFVLFFCLLQRLGRGRAKSLQSS